ncbi:MAG TPA: HAD hydrolase family protein, partial [Thermodesulfobacteriota bacterium]|nr:HAD hydrolase family protein [Thermodesulfobacteriota bacterium]
GIRLVLLDVDGVLTDGRLIFDGAGRDLKSFHIRDGQGIKLLQSGGVRVGILSGRSSKAAEARCRELGMDMIHTGVKDKYTAFRRILENEKLSPEEVCYMGDDLVDIPVLSRVGLALAVADSIPEVKGVAHFVTRLGGGAGAVREASEKILKSQGKWNALVCSFLASAS